MCVWNSFDDVIFVLSSIHCKQDKHIIAGIAEVRVCHILLVQHNFKVFICTYVCTCVLKWSEADKRSEFSSIGNYFFYPKSLPMI